jgi:hypothetical protein
MTQEPNSVSSRLVDKSIEAFLMAIELYNKPTIKYRAEGFSFFICNAWELLLKAHMVNTQGANSVYYKNKGNRTLSLSECLRKVFTNKNDPLRKNIERIDALRNTSTHFITEEHEIVYVPLFQACVMNFDDKLFEFHQKRISDYADAHFLTLSMTANPIDPVRVRAKYSPEIAERLLFDENEVFQEQMLESNQKFSVVIRTEVAIVKNPDRADFTVRYDKDSDISVRELHLLQNPTNTHPYSTKKVVEHVNKQLGMAGVDLMVNEVRKEFNTFHWSIFSKFYGFKGSVEYGYEHKIGESPSQYTYSRKVVDLIVGKIKENPKAIISDLKEVLKKRG